MNYSLDIIRRYREMDDADAFDREVVSHVPVDLNNDEITLACGHTITLMRRFMRLTKNGKFHCKACEQAWLEQAVKEEHEKPGE